MTRAGPFIRSRCSRRRRARRTAGPGLSFASGAVIRSHHHPAALCPACPRLLSLSESAWSSSRCKGRPQPALLDRRRPSSCPLHPTSCAAGRAPDLDRARGARYALAPTDFSSPVAALGGFLIALAGFEFGNRRVPFTRYVVGAERWVALHLLGSRATGTMNFFRALGSTLHRHRLRPIGAGRAHRRSAGFSAGFGAGGNRLAAESVSAGCSRPPFLCRVIVAGCGAGIWRSARFRGSSHPASQVECVCPRRTPQRCAALLAMA